MTIHRVGTIPTRTAGRAAVLVVLPVVVLLVVVAVPSPAGAAGIEKATAAKTESVTTAKWAATLSATSLVFATSTDQTSTVTNTGTVTLVAISYKVTVSNPVSGSPTFTLFVCPVAWSANTCSGGAGTQVGGTFTTNSTTTVSSAVVPAIAGHVYLQVQPTGVTASTTVTLGTTITSANQLRAAIKTNQ